MLLLLFFLPRNRVEGAPVPPRRPRDGGDGGPTGTVHDVQQTHTGQVSSRQVYVQTRLAAALGALYALHMDVPLQDVARQVDGQLTPDEVHAILTTVARHMVAHWWQETGEGRSEWNYNVGNLKAFGSPTAYWDGSRVSLRHNDGSHAFYRAYSSLDEGARDYLRLISTGRYLDSFGTMLATAVQHPNDVRSWFDALTRAGYRPYSDAGSNEVATIDAQIARMLTDVPASAGATP